MPMRFPARIPVDAQRSCKLSRAVIALRTAQQHALRLVGPPGDDIQHPVHPIAKIHEDGAAVMVQHLAAPAAAAAGVAGGIALAGVGLRLRDVQPQHPPAGQGTHQQLADQIGRHSQHVPVKKSPVDHLA